MSNFQIFLLVYGLAGTVSAVGILLCTRRPGPLPWLALLVGSMALSLIFLG